jgi:hypothetical protein
VLGAEVADRHAVGGDDRDDHEVADARGLRGAHEVRGGDVVALRPAREVQHDVGALDGRRDAVVAHEVGDDVLDARDRLAPAAAEDAQVVLGGGEEVDDVGPEGAGPAGDEDGHVPLTDGPARV